MQLAARTLELELSVARLQGRLQGDSAEDQFQNYLKAFRQPEVLLPFLEEYPVLAREFARTVDRSVAFELEFLQHLCADADMLGSLFMSGAELGLLANVQGVAGDTHRGGRSVRIVEFSFRASKNRLPTSTARCRSAFSGVARLAEPTRHPASISDPQSTRLRPPRLDGMRRRPALHNIRRGRALLPATGRTAHSDDVWSGNAADVHSENIIAAGDQPILIDFETAVPSEYTGMGLAPGRPQRRASSVGFGNGAAAGAAGPASQRRRESAGASTSVREEDSPGSMNSYRNTE